MKKVESDPSGFSGWSLDGCFQQKMYLAKALEVWTSTDFQSGFTFSM